MKGIRVVGGLAILVAGVWAVLLGMGGFDQGITHGMDERPMVALTFDDGLNEHYTVAVADILERYGARGTFFIVGRPLAEQASLAQRLRERGHLLANHSYTHTRAMRSDVQYNELSRTQAAFEEQLGACPRFFRPPYGTETVFTKAAVQRAGMQTVLWDVEVADWGESNPQRLAARVLGLVHAGAIVLLHDGLDGRPGADRSVLVAALPIILDGLRARGLMAVGVDELLGAPGYLDQCG